ncbi:glycosyltransferase family 8 protein [Sporomusa carbonis]|uniref:glycosyltransferase family 8 protein n=1 Tax=Sporomusa carbonis TaxID=3076075 RepID=UPI003C7974B1
MESDIYLRKAIDEYSLFEGRKHCFPSVEDIHIGYGIDENYVRCMGASIASICFNNRRDNLVFHVLANGLKKDSMTKLNQLANDFNVNIHVYAINNRTFKHLPVQAHFPASIYYRFILPAILTVPKILYLDADIICLGEIQSLPSVDMQANVVAAVPDLESLASKRNHILGLKQHTYFNSGVLLIDIQNWNNHYVAKKALALLEQEPKKFRYPDQDVLNVVLTGKVKYLGKEWNRINTPDMVDNGIILLHFAAHPKPWSIAWGKSDLCNDFTRNIYSKYENLSPWKNSKPTEPQNYKEMKYYAQCLLKAGDYKEGFYWYGRYLKTKMKTKLCAGNGI